MSRIAYVNGRYVPQHEAAVNVEDRGYQFADGVYEVIAVERGRLIDLEYHFERLDRSLRELRIRPPCDHAALAVVLREVLRRNRVADGIVYLQITRGVARRGHAFPAHARTALVVTAARKRPPSPAAFERGMRVITAPDLRWKRPDIKTVSLLPNVLAKQQAVEAGAEEAWLVDGEGRVTEGSSTNAWIVVGPAEVVTRPLGNDVLAGVTRRTVIEVARDNNIRIVERSFTVEEAKRAREAFLTSTTSYVMPVVAIDGEAVGDGRPGPVTRLLLEAYRRRIDGAPGR
jgi:D-alanine transaminase